MEGKAAENISHPSTQRRLSSSGMSNRINKGIVPSRMESGETSDGTKKKLAEMGY
jgi:hypothetical protein